MFYYLFIEKLISGADTALNLMKRGPRKIDWVGVGGGAPNAGGSAPQANSFMRIG